MDSDSFQSTETLAGVSVADVQSVLAKKLSHRRVGWAGWSLNDLALALGIESSTALDLATELIRRKLVVQIPDMSGADLFGNERVFHTTIPGGRMMVEYRHPPKGQDPALYAEQPEEVIEEEMKVCEKARECISLLATYRRKERHEISVMPAGGLFAHGSSTGRFSFFHIGLRKPIEWFNWVYQNDLAVMEDQFVLAILERIGERSLIVAVARQGPRCSLRLVPVVAVLSDAGSWQLRWKGLGVRAFELLNSVKSPQNENPRYMDEHYMQAMRMRMSSALDKFERYAFGPSQTVRRSLDIKEE